MRFLASLALLLATWAPMFADTFVYVSVAAEKRIAVYKMDPDGGKLTHVTDTKVEGEPGALAVDPARRWLFASLRASGKLASFRIDRATGKLTHLKTVPAGADPSYVRTDRAGHFLLTAYYAAGKVTVHAISKGGVLGEKALQSIPTAKNAHAIVPDPLNRFVFVPHTGPNAIFQFTFAAGTGTLSPSATSKVTTPPGTGPRHLVFHPRLDIAYVDNEQGSSVTAYALDPKLGTLKAFQTVSTLPNEFKGENSCAEVKAHPTGKFLYVSNRGHDSIARFTIDVKTGRLTAAGQEPTEKTPRSFDLDRRGRFLYAAGEGSGKVASYRIEARTGALKQLATYDVGKQPWWVMVVEMPAE